MAERREIVVVGEGSATGVPDRCVVSLALHQAADTSAGALDGVARLAGQVVEAIRAHDVGAGDVQTSDVSLRDVYDKDRTRVTARIASYGLSVSVAGLDRTGPLVRALAEVAGDSLQVRELRLEMSDPQPVLDEARRAAVTDALDRARQLGAAAGVGLGPILGIEEGSGLSSHSPRNRPWARTAAAADVLPVEAGTSSVTVRVTVRLAMAD